MPLDRLLLAFGPFTNPIMLGWLAAAAAPIVIHLLSRRRYRDQTWAAMQFLLDAIQKNSRRIRIEQWILLAVRTLLLILLAGALAEPMVGGLASLGERLRGGVTHWVLVIDGSYSMDYRDTQQSAFERAKELAAKLASEAEQGDGFTLVLMGEPTSVVIREPAFDAADVARELELLSVRHGGAALEGTLGEVAALVEKVAEDHPRLRQAKVCFFSDLGANTWEAVEQGSVRRRIASLAEKATLRLFDVGQDGRENTAVVGLDVDEPVMTPDRDIGFRVEVQKFGGPETRRKVQLLVDGRRVAEESLTVAGSDVATANFRHRFREIGPHTVEVVLDHDQLPLDDRRWLSFTIRESLRVLCVEGRPRAARYVQLALQPSEQAGQSIVAETANETALLERELAPYDCVFLCNIARLGRDEAAVLRTYVEQGGALVVFLGDQVQRDSYNTWLGPRDRQPPLLPAEIQATNSTVGQYGFNPLRYEHPLVAPFRGHEQAGLLTTPIWKYFRLKPYEDVGAKVALAMDGGEPAIVESPVGRGRVILCATASSTASRTSDQNPWTAWATWPSFPPMVQEMLRYGVARRWDNRNLRVGQPILGVETRTDLGETITVSGPPHDGREAWSEKIPLELQGDRSVWSFAQTLWAGVYEARYENEETATPYAVNIDPAESVLSRLDPTLLPSQFERSANEEADEEDLADDGRQPYFRIFLVAVAACMVVESLLAWYFGNSGS